MSIQETLKELRKSRNLTQEEFSEKSGINLSSLRAWEAGRNIPNSLQRSKICLFFNIKESELFGAPPHPIEIKSPLIPIVSRVSASERGETMRVYDVVQPVEFISFKGCKALIVEGDSMSPVAFHGQKIIYSEEDTVKDGDLVFCKLESGDSYFKRYFKDKKNGLITLQSVNPSAPFAPISIKETETEFIYKIVGVRF